MTLSPELLAVLTVAAIQVFVIVWAIITYVDTHAELQEAIQSLKAITAQATYIVLQGRRAEDVLCEMWEELKK